MSKINSEVTQKGFIVTLSQIILGIIVPVFIFLTAKDNEGDQFLKDNARNAINFGIPVMILSSVLNFVPFGYIGSLVVWVGYIVLVVKAAQDVKQGNVHKYPFSYEFLK